jgi:carboxyl-terminal processing protease
MCCGRAWVDSGMNSLPRPSHKTTDMMTERRRIIRLAGLIAFGLTAAACTATPSGDAVADDSNSAIREMMIAGYHDIDSVYIDDKDLGELTVAGLNQLAIVDPTVALDRNGTEFSLLVDGSVKAVFEAPDVSEATEWGIMTANYIDIAREASPKLRELNDEQLYETLFGGIITQLDTYSRYASAARASENRASREGFGGVGVRIAVEDNHVRIVSVMHYTPAERAGLRADDVITLIDDTPATGLTLDAIVQKLRGPVDSQVRLTVERAGTPEPIAVTLKREHVVPETVVYEREGDVAIIRLYGFNAETSGSLEREIERAEQEIGPALAGFVLDLRNNPGGLLDQAVEVSDMLIDGDGSIVSTHGRHPDSHQFFEASSGDEADGLPIVVLINGNSASASEIVAAALQDTGRAVVIGSNSYGKGTVQTVLRLPNDGELTLTWARFHAPSGYTLNDLGVLPTICTAGAGANHTALMTALGSDRLPPLPVVWRNSVEHDDMAALDELRATCPAERDEQAVDLELALDLLHNAALYDRALRLGGEPTLTVSTEQPQTAQP